MYALTYIEKAEKKLEEYRQQYLFAREQKLGAEFAETSRLMMIAAEDTLRAAGFTVKYSAVGYTVRCKWDDAPEDVKK